MSKAELERLRPGIVRADGVFETMRVTGGRTLFLAMHLARLRRGLKALRISSPVKISALPDWIAQIVQANRLKQARVRVMIYKKKGRISWMISAVPFRASAHRRGWSAIVSTGQRKMFPSCVKPVRYETFLKAYQEAQRKGVEEALLLNARGEIVEGSRTNLFAVNNGRLVTPPLDSGCLDGVTRRVVIDLTKTAGLHVVQKTLTLPQLLQCDEAFLTNAMVGVVPLTAVNGQRIGRGPAGPLTRRLLKRYLSRVRTETRRADGR